LWEAKKAVRYRYYTSSVKNRLICKEFQFHFTCSPGVLWRCEITI
jgi:hypothetical protein